MDVARAFRAQLDRNPNLSSDLDLGRHYIDYDPETAAVKLRERDVVVRATKSHHGRAWMSAWLSIECKSSKADPWVFYRASGRIDLWPKTLAETAWTLVVGNGLAQGEITGWPGNQLITATVNNCYGAASTSDRTQNGNRPNHARDAIMQAISASRGVARDIPDEDNAAAIVIPVVVTAAPMVAVELTAEGHKLIDTTREVVSIRYAPGDDVLSKAWVVHESEVGALATDFVNLAAALEYWP